MTRPRLEAVFVLAVASRREDILGMEKNMLAALEYDLTVPTCYLFVARFRKAAGVQDDIKVCCPYWNAMSASALVRAC